MTRSRVMTKPLLCGETQAREAAGPVCYVWRAHSPGQPKCGVGESNPRPSPKTPGETGDSSGGAAPGAASAAQSVDALGRVIVIPHGADAALRRLLDKWASLPESLRDGITAMIDSVK